MEFRTSTVERQPYCPPLLGSRLESGMVTKPRSPWMTDQLQTNLYHTSCGNFQCNLMLSALERIGGVSINDPPVPHVTSAQDSQPSPWQASLPLGSPCALPQLSAAPSQSLHPPPAGTGWVQLDAQLFSLCPPPQGNLTLLLLSPSTATSAFPQPPGPFGPIPDLQRWRAESRQLAWL